MANFNKNFLGVIYATHGFITLGFESGYGARSVSYGQKKFYEIGPRDLYYITFYGRNLLIFVIS